MERTYINEVQKEIGSTVKVQGFIENLRNSKYMAFIVLKDITGKLQITVEKADHPDLVDTIDKLTPDSVITVTGKVMENDYVKMGGNEIAPRARSRSRAIAEALPIERKEYRGHQEEEGGRALLASISASITAGSTCAPTRTSSSSRRRPAMANAMRQFLLERNFIEIHTPKLIGCGQRERLRGVRRWNISTATPTLHRARSSTSRWPWPPGSSASSRPALCSVPEKSYTSTSHDGVHRL